MHGRSNLEVKGDKDREGWKRHLLCWIAHGQRLATASSRFESQRHAATKKRRHAPQDVLLSPSNMPSGPQVGHAMSAKLQARH